MFAGNPEQYKVALNWVRQATKKNLQEAARRWLSDGVYVLEVYPFPELKTVTTSVDRSKLPDTATPGDVPLFQLHLIESGLKVPIRNRIMTGGLEQQVVNHRRVRVRDVADRRRQRADDMEIRLGKQLGFPLGEPFARRSALALRTITGR